MLNMNDYQLLEKYKVENPELARILNSLEKDRQAELSTISHELKNIASTLNSSSQFVEEKMPSVLTLESWNRIHSIIEYFIEYMNKTSDYRYSMVDKPVTDVSINELLFTLPDFLDDHFENNCEFEFDTSDIPSIKGNSDHLLMLFKELAINAAEACLRKGTIKIHTYNDDKEIYIEIINELNDFPFEDDETTSSDIEYWDLETIAAPFYTEKKRHIGLGLSILHQICLKYNYSFSLFKQGVNTTAQLIIPY